MIDKIFHDGYSLYNKLRVLQINAETNISICNYDRTAIIENFKKRRYQAPNEIKINTTSDKIFYALCCYVDRTLEISLSEIYDYLNLIEQLDFFADIGKKTEKKNRNIIISALSLPMSHALIGKCEAERDHIFMAFHEFRAGHLDAAAAYEKFEILYKDLRVNKVRNTEGFIHYFYMELYAFRCFFDKAYKEHRKDAESALVNGTEFKYAR